jgi:predicted Zn finger-like uncharacterized protein
MPIATTCPNCKALFRLADELVGKKVKCQKCQSVFIVPQSEASMTTPGVLASASQNEIEPPPQPALAAPVPPQLPPLPPPPMNPPDLPSYAVDDDRYTEAAQPPPVAKRPRDADRPAPRARSEQAKSGSGSLPVVLTLLGVSVLSCLGCLGVSAVWRFAATKRAELVKQKKDVVKIHDRKEMKKGGPIEGFKDKNEVPPPPGPPILVNFGPDGIFRQNNQLTRLDPIKFNQVQQQNKRHKVYSVRLEANRTYQINLISVDFDAFLYLVDNTGQVVAWDDDGGRGINGQDARIIHTPGRTGLYQIEATHFGDVRDPNLNTIGNFTLIVQRIL